jgi:tetratricopeptide (TPR) repeat protein
LLTDEELFGEQVVEQLVSEGYHHLGDDERRVMEALAIFDRPVEEAAVAYLLHPWYPGLDVHSCLRRLVGGYFVSASRVTGKYSLHPLDREYAYGQLPDPPEEGEAPDNYNRHNLELRAADFYAIIRKPESEWQTIDDLEPQLAEFEHRVRAEDYNGAYGVLESTSPYLFLRGHYTRLVESQEKLLTRLTDPVLELTNMGNLGRAYHYLGQFEQATKFFQRAVSISRKIDDVQSECTWLGRLGIAYRNLGLVERAVNHYEQALEIARRIGDRWGESLMLGNLGLAQLDLGQTEQAIEQYEKALIIARDVGDRMKESAWLGQLGNVHRALGQVKLAKELYEKALAISREAGDRRGESNRLGNLGLIYLEQGQAKQAVECHKQALAIAHKIGNRLGESYQFLWLGRALLATMEVAEAQCHCEEALAMDVPETNYQAALVLGIVLLYQGSPTVQNVFEDAATRCKAMLDKTTSLHMPRYTLAAALAGSAICDLRWTDESQRPELLAPALAEYRCALEITSAPGIVRDALRDLEMIRAAGIEGLEPAFELLETGLKAA